MEIFSLIIGLLVGVIACIIFYLLNKSKTVARNDFENLSSKYSESIIKSTTLDTQLQNSAAKIAELSLQLTKGQTLNIEQQDEINLYKQKIAELTANNRSVSDNLSKQYETNQKQTAQMDELNAKLADQMALVSRMKANIAFLQEKLTTQKTDFEELQKTAHLQFEKIANKLFEEKSSKFTETNKTNIETLLSPLKEDINKFKTKVEETYDRESKQRFSLEEKVKDLIEQTNKVSAEANNLATALKGKPQKRGNWGEMILERILESSGLTKDREYFIQQTMKDEEGNVLRPDVIVKLPDERDIIIDSKVSLIAYDKFVSTDNADEQKMFLSEHLSSTYNHINQLSAKRYSDLETSFGSTIMFVPVEPAFFTALQGDPDLWDYAYSKRVLLVSPTNLIACLKLISDLWKREWQNKNAMEIVHRGEKLYEKFVGFTKSFEEIGKKIQESRDSYDRALGQLKDGRGNIINQAIQLKELGLKSDKKISANLLPSSFDYEVEDENEVEQ
jgi:DNA recombination protein RmuC